MNYYEKIIQQKNNARDYDEINKVYKEAKRIVDDLRRKYREISGRERDDGNFLYSIIEEKGMRTDSGDQQKAKHAAGLLESVRRMSTVPRDWGNSKGETNMGYYADLIEEKKEKQNSIVKKGTFNKGTYTIDKTTGMFGRTVYIVHVHYEKGPSKDMTFGSDSFETLQDAQKYADRLNSKEEKDNASVQDRFRYKGCMITILKKGENQYTFSVEQNGREEGSNKVYPSQDKAESEAKREVETNWNEKEETENASEADIRAMYSQIQELKKKGIKGENIDKFYAAVNYRAAAEEHRKKYKQTGQEGYRIAAEKADRQADQWIKEINRSIRNEKEEGYYAKLAKEKAAKKNSKSWRVEFLGNSHYIETIADAESAQSKAQRDLAIKERQLSQQGEEIRQEYWEFSQQIRNIEKEIESQKTK